MKLNCTSCGYKIDLDEAYGDFAGSIKCYICKSILEIRTEDGQIKMVKVAGAAPLPVSAQTPLPLLELISERS